MVAMEFPKKGEYSRRKCKHGNDRFYKKIAKLEKEKRNLTRANARLRKRKERAKKASTPVTTITPRSKVCSLMKQNGISPSKAPTIKKKLLYADAISSEIRKSIQERKNKRESIRRVISGQILRKYKLICYTAMQTLTDRGKLSKTKSKTIDLEKQKRGFQPELHNQVLDFYRRDDVSIVLPGKRDVKKIGKKKPSIQKRVLSDYLSNFYEKFVAENTNVKISFSTFARMRPTNFVLANFANRQSCLCVQHRNMSLKLKI